MDTQHQYSEEIFAPVPKLLKLTSVTGLKFRIFAHDVVSWAEAIHNGGAPAVAVGHQPHGSPSHDTFYVLGTIEEFVTLMESQTSN